MIPIMMTDNVLSVTQYPGHTLTVTEEAQGNPIARIADGRRTEYWTGVTENLQQDIGVTFDRPRLFDYFALDWGHNLTTVAFEVSNGTAKYSLPQATIPPMGSFGALDDPNGTRTYDGAWLALFEPIQATEFIVSIPAAAGFIPRISLLSVGLSFRARALLRNGWTDNTRQLLGDVSETSSGYRGVGNLGSRRRGEIALQTAGDINASLAEWHLVNNFGRGRPMWVCLDKAAGFRSVFAYSPLGQSGTSLGGGWFWPQGRFPWVEEQPRQEPY